MRHDRFTTYHHYCIRFFNGTHQVRRDTPEWEEDNETVFEGHYEDCVKFIDRLVAEDLESILF
jgi:hypothetical protein